MDDTSIITEPLIEDISELDLVVTQEPTNVWLLRDGTSVDDLRLYEQWEQGRPFKAKAIYHHPSGVDYYLRNEDDPFGVLVEDTDSPYEVDELSLAPIRPGKRHQIKDGEDIYSIGLHYKVPWQKILEHNEVELDDIGTGMWLYIPTHHEAKERQDIEYRLLEEPRAMHISHPGGTTKFSFGGVKELADIKAELKVYDQDYNVTIHAIAKVPIENDLYAYYMDKHDLGSYSETNRPAYTRGYNWRHLAEGHITVEKPASKVEKIVADAMMEDNRPALPERMEITPEVVVEPEPIVEAIEESPTSPLELELDDYKNTFKYLNIEESPEEFEMLEDHSIRELDGAMPPKFRKAGARVPINGWFTYKGTPYFRVATKYWYAIPTQMAYPVEDEPFNDFTVDMKTRLTYGGELTKEERQVARLAKIAARYNRIKTLSGMLRRK